MLEAIARLWNQKLAEKAKKLADKEKELRLKDRKIKTELKLLHKDSLIIDKLREVLDRKHKAFKEYEAIVKAHHKESKEIGKVLRIINNLMEKLPDKEIDIFLKSKKFKLYQKAMQKYVK